MNEYLYDDAAMENVVYDDFPEDVDYDYPEDVYYDEDFDYDEATRVRDNRNRARAHAAHYRALAQARMRTMQDRRRRIAPAPPPRPIYSPPTATQPASTTQVRQGFSRVGTDVQRIKANLRNVDLDTKVQSDLISRALKTQGARITGSEYALAASTITDQLTTQFPDLVSHPLLKTAIPLLPLIFLKPQRRGSGFGSIISDPRFWGPGAAFAILGLKELLERNREVTTSQPGTSLGSGTVASQNGALTQGELAALAALLNKLSEQVAQAAQAAQIAQAAVAAQSPDALRSWLMSLMTQSKEYAPEASTLAPQEPTQTSKSKASKDA